MRVVRLGPPGGPDALPILEEVEPAAVHGEVQVRIRACSLNVHDEFVVKGMFPIAPCRVPLLDGGGEVVAVGTGVEGLAPGDRVVSFYPRWLVGEMTETTRADIVGDRVDSYARELVAAPAHAFTKAPAGWTDAEATTLPCAAVTAWRGLVVAGQVRAGDTVLTLGTGPVSLFAMQFVKASGAKVIAVTSDGTRAARLHKLGVGKVIDSGAVPDWGARAQALSGGRGVDHVMEVVGPATLGLSLDVCRIGGHLALMGVLSGFSGDLSIPSIVTRQARVTGISLGSREDQLDMIRAIEASAIRPLIDSIFPLAEIAGALRHREARHPFGKVCIEL